MFSSFLNGDDAQVLFSPRGVHVQNVEKAAVGIRQLSLGWPKAMFSPTVRLIGYSHMISCRSVAQVRRWSDTSELAKIADEVRLIEIAGRVSVFRT